MVKNKTIKWVSKVAPALVQKKLDSIYGPIQWRPRMVALDELIFTVLTQHTSDLNAERAYDSLRKQFPTWGEVAEADPVNVEKSIHRGLIAYQKSVRIQSILAEIVKRIGRFELEFLSDLPIEETREWLTTLPGLSLIHI